MRITIFGVIWILVICWCMWQKNIKYMVFITLLFMTFQCDTIFFLGNVGVGPQILTSSAFIAKCVFNARWQLRFRRSYAFLSLLALGYIAVIVVSYVMNDITESRTIMYIVQLFIYIVCFLCMIHFVEVMDGGTLYQLIRTVSIFILAVGVVQYLTTSAILPEIIRPVLKTLFFNEDSLNIGFNYGYYPRVTSVFMEPSYFAPVLTGMFYYFLSMQKEWSKNFVLLGLIFLELILTRSSTAYGAFLVVGILFILFQAKIKLGWKVLLTIVAAIGFLCIFVFFYDILNDVIFSKSSSDSYIIRIRSNAYAQEQFQKSPWYGIGYREATANSIIYSLLGELGIIGFSIYVVFNLKCICPVFQRGKRAEAYDRQEIAIRFALLSAIVCQIIAVGQVDMCSYWFWAYVLALSMGIRNVSVKELAVQR